jgi:hypothetical protein
MSMKSSTRWAREFWGAHAPSRAGDRAPAIANLKFQNSFGEGAETGTRGACAP